MKKNLPKSVRILISEQIGMLEWFLIITCKEHTLLRSTNRFSRNHPKLCFWLIRKDRQMPNAVQLLCETDKSSHQRCSIKKAALERFAILRGKHQCWSLFFNFIKKRLQRRCFIVAKFLTTPILMNIWVRMILKWLQKVIV